LSFLLIASFIRIKFSEGKLLNIEALIDISWNKVTSLLSYLTINNKSDEIIPIKLSVIRPK
jgi:hypothetical protein